MAQIFSIFRFVWPFLRNYQGRLFGAILAGIVFGISNAGVLWLTKTVLSRLDEDQTVAAAESPAPAGNETFQNLTGEVDTLKRTFDDWLDDFLNHWFPRKNTPVTITQLLGIILGLPLLVSLRSGSEYLSAYWMSWVGHKMVNDLRVIVLDKLSQLPLGYFNRAKIGDMTTRIDGDTRMLQVCMSQGVKHSITDPVTVVAVFTFLMFMDWRLMFAVTILLPICLWPIIVFGRRARQASGHQIQTNVTQSNLIIEMLSSIRVVKAFGLEKRQVNRFRDLSRQLFGYTMKGVRSTEIVGPIIETFSMVAVGTLIVWVVQSDRNVPELITFFIGLIMFYDPIKKLARLHVLFKQTGVGIERLKTVLAETPEIEDHRQGSPVGKFSDCLRFEGVSFAYRDQPVLRHVDLTIPRGLKLGIAGESGSGKSSLINLLFRFFDPSHGSIRLDGTDLREFNLDHYRRQLALVSQDVVVFDQTVAENIRCGRLNASRADIVEAARQAHALEFIESLEHGFDTKLGERGISLSGGQRQRIALARAFVRNAPIMVLDEATASLDARSESEIQKAVEELTDNRTIIYIAHRLATLRSMDEIIVLKEGEIVERGTYASLMVRDGIFANLARRQHTE